MLLYKTKLGRMYLGDSQDILSTVKPNSIDLVITSPPYPIAENKGFDLPSKDDYLAYFEKEGSIPLREETKTVLTFLFDNLSL